MIPLILIDHKKTTYFALLCIPPAGGGKNLIPYRAFITEFASR